MAYGSIFSSEIEAIRHSGNNYEKQKKIHRRATISVAVGSYDFERRTRLRIGIRVKRRKVVEKGGAYTLPP